MTQRPAFYPLRGGLDLITPAIEVRPGRAIGGVNYEPLERGYGRILGYERLDGRPKPSEASYWIMDFEDGSAALVEGDVLTGQDSGHTGTVLLDATPQSGSFGAGTAAGEVVLTQITQPEAADSFLTPGTLPDLYALTRDGSATFFNSSGVLQTAAANVPRWHYFWNGSSWVLGGLLVEARRTNHLRNNTGVGAAAGTPGTLPTNWSIGHVVGGTFTPNATLGLTFQVVGTGTEAGIEYVDIRLSGTSNAAGLIILYMEAAATISASFNQFWATSAFVKVAAGDFTNIETRLRIQADDNNSDVLWTYWSPVLSGLTGGLSTQRAFRSAQTHLPETAYVRPNFGFSVGNASAVDLTLRIGLPDMVLTDIPGTPIRTSGATVQRQLDVLTKTLPNNVSADVTILRQNTWTGSTFTQSLGGQQIRPDFSVPYAAYPIRQVNYDIDRIITQPGVLSFSPGESLLVNGAPVATAVSAAVPRAAASDVLNRQYLQTAIATARAAIEQVPGAGPVRGVWQFEGATWAIRDDDAGDSAGLYKSTSGGWERQSLGQELRFDAGTAAFVAGETLTGGTSGTTAEIKRVILDSGTWGGSNAVGRLVMGPSEGSGFENNETITSASGSATADGVGVNNLLPNGGRYEFHTYNFGGLAERRAMYAANGVGRAFEWDGETFTWIRTGLSDALDKPTYVSAIANHLILGFASGSLQISAIGDPLQWTVVLGAGEIALGEPLTGMLAVVDGTLVITGETRIAVLYGRSTADFQLRTFTDDGGAAPWSLQRIGDPLYLDDRGIRSLAQTEAFGNFLRGTATRSIEPLLRRLLKSGRRPVASFRIQAKDQYRLIWDDGTGLAIYLGREGSAPESMPLDFSGMVPTCAASVKDGADQEVVLFGAADGFVYQMEAGNSFDGEPITSFVRLPFNHVGHPTRNKRWHKATLEIDASPTLDLKVVTEISYGDPLQPGGIEQNFSVSGGGGFWNEVDWNEFYWSTQVEGQAEVWIDRVGANISICAFSSSADEPPHLLHGLTLHYTFRSLRR